MKLLRIHCCVLLSLSACAGCGQDRERNEAVLLLDRLARLETPDADQRRERLEALEHMPIASPEVARVRDSCVPMHRALLDAEEASAGVRGAIAAVGGEQHLSPAQRRDVEAALERSSRRLAVARRERTGCVDGQAALRTRFGIERQ